MAVITLAAPISGIRGKVGGLVYSANKSGPYVKQWAKGTNPRSLLQTNHRASLAGLSIEWKNLSGAEKTSWIDYAADASNELFNSLGEGFFASGINWFIRINLNRFSFGDSLKVGAPSIGVPATPNVQQVGAFSTDNAGVTNIKLNAGSPGLGERLAIKAELRNSDGEENLAQIKTFMLTQKQDISVVNFAFKTELLEHFGTAQIGQVVFATIQHQNADGRRSAPASGRRLITA